MKNKIKKCILVGAGKGGTGKSTISVLIAIYLKSLGYNVGIYDCDISGPSIPKLTGISSCLRAKNTGIQPELTEDNIPVVSIELFLNKKSTAIMWHGEKKEDYIITSLRDTDWNLEYLIVDLPPGNSEEVQSVIEYVQDCNIQSGIMFVSTPQEISLHDIAKSVSMVRRLDMPVLGIIENFGTFICDNCKKEHKIFGSGKVRKFCDYNNIHYLGSVPVIPELSKMSDNHLSLSTVPEDIKPVIKSITDHIIKEI